MNQSFSLRKKRVFLFVFANTVAYLAPFMVSAQEVIPDFYKDPGLYPNRSYVNQSFNEHIDPFTGALQHHYVDLNLPGNGGFDLKVVRSYNSASVDTVNPAGFISLSGVGWTIHFGRVLKTKETSVCVNKDPTNAADNPVLELQDGSRMLLAFTGQSSPLMTSTQRWRVDCNSSSGVTAYSPDGVRYDMTQMVQESAGATPVYAWYTTKITDRNGNYANVNYAASASPQITSITTSDGRAINFSYLDSGLLSRRISSISGEGKTTSYSYQAISGFSGKYQLTSVTRPDGRSWGYVYNGNLNTSPGGYLMRSITYPEGGSINYDYDHVYFDSQANPSSRSTVLKTKSRSSGGTWSFSYSPGGPGNYDTTTVNTPDGNIIYRHVGPNYSSSGSVWMVGLLVSKTIGNLQTETYTWGTQRVSSERYYRPGAFVIKVDAETSAPILTKKTVNRDGQTYTTTYSGHDSYGNPATVTESGVGGGNRTTSLSYYINTSKWIVNRIANESYSGSSTSRSFDTDGNMTSVTRDGVTTSYTYDNEGNVASITFPRGLVHRYSSHKRGIAQSETQPESISITRVVSDAGNVTSEKNGEGKTTTYAYDGLDRITAIGYPIGSTVYITYGTASKTVQRGSLTEATTYNGFGLPTRISLGGIDHTFQYDAFGRKIFQSHPDSSSGTDFSYDILGRVSTIRNADGTTNYMDYGPGSKQVTDERGKVTTFTYRAYGDPDKTYLMGISAPESSASVSIARNSRDLVTSVSQAGYTRTYSYNSNYYLTSVSNPETGTTSYGRDTAGNMTSRSVGSSGRTDYTYDGQNRLTYVSYPGSTPSVTNTYNKVGKLLSANSSTGSREYNYDANGNLISETLSVDARSYTATYGYNGLDQLSSMVYPRSGMVVNYSPDVLGRPTQVSGYANSVTYWPSGQVKSIAYANGTTSSYSQNSRLWPGGTTTAGPNGERYLNSSYTYDGVGNLKSIADTTDSTLNRTMGYDNINRLTSIAGPWGSGTITYSGAGNITNQAMGSHILNYTYNSSNVLTAVSGSKSGNYSYDDYGNVVSGAGNAYIYDGVPNLRCVNCTNANNKIEYSYDGANHRSIVTQMGIKKYEMWGANGNLLMEHSPSDLNSTYEYIYLGGKRIAQRYMKDAAPTCGPGVPTPCVSTPLPPPPPPPPPTPPRKISEKLLSK